MASAKILLASGDNESVIAGLKDAQLDENLTLDLATAYGRSGNVQRRCPRVERLRSRPTPTRRRSRHLSFLSTSSCPALTRPPRLPSNWPAAIPMISRPSAFIFSVLVFNADYQTATPLARKLLEQAPHDADFLYLNGVIERTSGDFAAARRHLEEAAKLDPNRYSIRFNLGYTLGAASRLRRRPRSSCKRQSSSTRLEPESHLNWRRFCASWAKPMQRSSSWFSIRKQVKDKSDQTIAAQKSTQAAEAARAGDKQKAAALYRDAIAALPDNAGLRYQLALFLNDLNDMEGERTALEQAGKDRSKFCPGPISARHLGLPQWRRSRRRAAVPAGYQSLSRLCAGVDCSCLHLGRGVAHPRRTASRR